MKIEQKAIPAKTVPQKRLSFAQNRWSHALALVAKDQNGLAQIYVILEDKGGSLAGDVWKNTDDNWKYFDPLDNLQVTLETE